VLPIVIAARTIPHLNPEPEAFYIASGIVGAYGLIVLAWVYRRPVTARFVIAATALDIAAITVLVAFSGGAFSEARLTYFLVPVAVAFRFRPLLTTISAVATVIAYDVQSFAHPAHHQPGAERFILVQTGYLVWLGLAAVLLSAVLLSAVLERRTERIQELAEVRRRLMTDALTAEERERRVLAEALHDGAIQNLLSARHELQEAADSNPHPSLRRAAEALAATIGELREALFELHPYVLEQAGLEVALRTLAQRAARRGGFDVQVDLAHVRRHEHEGLLLTAARELLTNVVQHAHAGNVAVRLNEEGSELVLAIEDDGEGFDPRSLPDRLAEGHIGLRSQRERIESIGGRVDVRSSPGSGALIVLRIPS
jgi:two-component system NarL family sensor kinase